MSVSAFQRTLLGIWRAVERIERAGAKKTRVLKTTENAEINIFLEWWTDDRVDRCSWLS
jgi:hypothetical protein